MTAAAPETPAVTPGQAAKSRVSVEATELNEAETGWVTAGVFVERDGEPDPDLAYQALDLNHGEMRALYDGLRLYYEQGIWSFRTVEREAIAARQPQPAPGLPQSAYLYHCKFGGLGGDEYGLFWREEDADAAAANRAGKGHTEVLGMAILGGEREQPAPELAAAMAQGPAGPLIPVGSTAVMHLGVTVNGEPQPVTEGTPMVSPELGAARAESRRYREALESVRAIILEGDNSTEGSRLRRSRAVIRAALEGK